MTPARISRMGDNAAVPLTVVSPQQRERELVTRDGGDPSADLALGGIEVPCSHAAEVVRNMQSHFYCGCSVPVDFCRGYAARLSRVSFCI